MTDLAELADRLVVDVLPLLPGPVQDVISRSGNLDADDDVMVGDILYGCLICGVRLDGGLLDTVERTANLPSFPAASRARTLRDVGLARAVNALAPDVAARIGAGDADADRGAAQWLAALELGIEVAQPTPTVLGRVAALWTPSQRQRWADSQPPRTVRVPPQGRPPWS